MSGKVLIEWRYPYCAQMTRRRYLDANGVRQTHSAISNIFFPADNEDRDGQGSSSPGNDHEDEIAADTHSSDVLGRDKAQPSEQPPAAPSSSSGIAALTTVPEDASNGLQQRSLQEDAPPPDERRAARASRKATSCCPHQPGDDTSTFYNPMAADVSYSMRHVEESWHHLMRSDDLSRFKQIAVCNFDFLLASVSSRSQVAATAC